MQQANECCCRSRLRKDEHASLKGDKLGSRCLLCPRSLLHWPKPHAACWGGEEKHAPLSYPHPQVVSINARSLRASRPCIISQLQLLICLPSSTPTHTHCTHTQAHDHRARTCAKATVSLLLPLPRPPACVFCASCLLPWRLPVFLPAAVRVYVSFSLTPVFLSLRLYCHMKQGMLISLIVRRGLRNCPSSFVAWTRTLICFSQKPPHPPYHTHTQLF